MHPFDKHQNSEKVHCLSYFVSQRKRKCAVVNLIHTQQKKVQNKFTHQENKLLITKRMLTHSIAP